LTGKVDFAMTIAPQFGLLVDWKKSSIPNSKDFNRGLEPQLALYALAGAQDGIDGTGWSLANTIVGHYNILSGEFAIATSGSGSDAIAKQFKWTVRRKKLEDITTTVKSLWNLRHEEVVTGRFAADTSQCEDFCSDQDLCRKGSPEHHQRLDQQKRLKKLLGIDKPLPDSNAEKIPEGQDP